MGERGAGWVFVQGVRQRVNTPLTLGAVVHCKGHLVGFQSEVDEGFVASTPHFPTEEKGGNEKC